MFTQLFWAIFSCFPSLRDWISSRNFLFVTLSSFPNFWIRVSKSQFGFKLGCFFHCVNPLALIGMDLCPNLHILNLRVHVWHPQQLSKVPPPCHSWFRHGEISHYDHISSPQWQKDMTNPLHTTHISSTQKQKRYNYTPTTPQLNLNFLLLFRHTIQGPLKVLKIELSSLSETPDTISI